jgi:biopolymer transport protein ExbD
MAFSSNSGSGAMCDINVTPLVDVLLVLLIIFMVTAPPLSYQIQVDLPQKSTTPPPKVEDPPEPIRVRIDASGNITWNGSATPVTALQSMFDVEGAKEIVRQPTRKPSTKFWPKCYRAPRTLAWSRSASWSRAPEIHGILLD